MSWLVPEEELTTEQQRAVEMSTAANRAIIGGPGSGKTQILLHRARYLCDTMDVSDDRFKIFVYTNVLKDYIKSAFQDLNLPATSVLTFNQWCHAYYQQNISAHLPWDAVNRTPDFSAISSAVMSVAEKKGKLFDFVLVDEGQDLPKEVFSFLSKVSSHVTVCLDSKQQIYDNGSTEAEVLRQLGIQQRDVNLIDAFRVCPYLVDVASCLIPHPAERNAFLNQSRLEQIERQTPLVFFAKDFDEEKHMLYQVVRERQLRNESIAILLPQKRQVFGFAQGLRDVGIDVEVPAQRGRNNNLPTHDFSSSLPKLMPYHSAKGLTFDSVLMPRLVPSSFSQVHHDRIERLLFVAITRATTWCYFSTSIDKPLSIIEDKLVPLANSRKLTIQKGGTIRHVQVNVPETSDDLDFL